MPVLSEFSQQVVVDNRLVRVHDLSIKMSSSQRVTSIDFVVEQLEIEGQAAAYDASVVGAEVVVLQAVGDDVETWYSTVVDVNEKRTSDYSFKRLQCRSLEQSAINTRFLDLWRKEEASTVVLEAWQRHAGSNSDFDSLSLSGIDVNTTRIEEYSSEFGSLYELMEEICLLTGWAWSLIGTTLYFFDPLTNIGPDITQSDKRIERDTIDLKVSLQGVFNVYRMQAWQYSTLAIGNTFVAGDCVDGFLFNPDLIRGVEVVGIPRIQQSKWRDEGLEVNSVEQEGIVTLNKSVTASDDLRGPLTIDLETRRLVWVERLDEISVIKYGRRDAPPLGDNGGMTIAAATQFLDTMLGYRATPAADLTLSVLGVGWRPDMVVTVTLDDPPLSAALYITDVTRTTDGSDLSVSITLTSPSEVIEGAQVQAGAKRSRSTLDPAYEIGRRLERLERKVAHPAQALGQSTGIFGVFGGSYVSTEYSAWQQITTVKQVNRRAEAQGWRQSVFTSLDNDVFVADSQGWQQTVTTNINNDIGITDSQGWQQTVTTNINNDIGITDSQGWQQTVVTNILSNVAVDTGWAQSVNFEIIDSNGTTIDDDVGVPVGGTTADDDVGVPGGAGTSVDNDISLG